MQLLILRQHFLEKRDTYLELNLQGLIIQLPYLQKDFMKLTKNQEILRLQKKPLIYQMMI